MSVVAGDESALSHVNVDDLGLGGCLRKGREARLVKKGLVLLLFELLCEFVASLELSLHHFLLCAVSFDSQGLLDIIEVVRLHGEDVLVLLVRRILK